mmetsp:Transcript_39033/g.78737  ORF Transcript_39033/g.78737 Transcript_39033/m.78737 type:complete len:248 (+) Transcript_39033:1407-2150(+)
MPDPIELVAAEQRCGYPLGGTLGQIIHGELHRVRLGSEDMARKPIVVKEAVSVQIDHFRRLTHPSRAEGLLPAVPMKKARAVDVSLFESVMDPRQEPRVLRQGLAQLAVDELHGMVAGRRGSQHHEVHPLVDPDTVVLTPQAKVDLREPPPHDLAEDFQQVLAELLGTFGVLLGEGPDVVEEVQLGHAPRAASIDVFPEVRPQAAQDALRALRGRLVRPVAGRAGRGRGGRGQRREGRPAGAQPRNA